MARKGIVWLASYPRSGNTWVRNFLYNLLSLLEAKGVSNPNINRAGEFSAWDIASSGFEKVLGKPITNATRSEIASARSIVQSNLVKQAKGPALVKTHNALVLDHGFPTINMAVTSGAVYIVRNPLDVVISLAHHFGQKMEAALKTINQRGFETDISTYAGYEVYGSWSQHVLSWTHRPHRAIYVVRYEDMLHKPIVTFTALAKHLLISASEQQIANAIDLSSFERAKAEEEVGGYAERPPQSKAFFREGRAGQWQKILSEDQVRTIVSAHREQMERFDYLP